MATDKLKKLQEMITLVSESITEADFVKAFEDVIKYVKKVEKELGVKFDNHAKESVSDLKKLYDEHKEALQELDEQSSLSITSMKRRVNEKMNDFLAKSKLNEKINKKIKEVDNKIKEIDSKEWPDKEQITEDATFLAGQNVLEELPNHIELKDVATPADIRDSLESLEGDERLDKSAVKDLEEDLEDLEVKIRQETTKVIGAGFKPPTLAKGDIIVHNGTFDGRLAVGTNDYVLTADSTQASGVKWAAATGGTDLTGLGVDNRLTRWNGTDTVQSSGITVDDSDNISGGTWQGTAVGIAYGGSGQTTQQAAIDALTAVSAATDEHVLTKDTATGNAIWKAAAGGGGSGDVVGPASASDNAIARYDTTTGKLIQNSGVLIDDSDNISGITDTISFDNEDINIGGGAHGTIGTGCLAVGFDAVASGVNSTAVGHSTDATGIDSTCFGSGAQATGQDSAAFGKGAVCSAQAAVAFGSESVASTAIGASAFGAGVTASAQNALAAGRNADASGVSSTALGTGTTASSSGSLAMGQNANCSAANSAAFGQNSDATNTGTLALGAGAQATGSRAIAIGQNATAAGNNQCVIGGATIGPHEMYVGDGVTAAAPSATFTFSSCGGSGTDIAGTKVYIAASKNTGNSTNSELTFQTPDSTTSGTTLQTLVDRMTIDTDGKIEMAHNGTRENGEVIVNDTVSTTDATVTTLATIATTSDRIYHVTTTVIATETAAHDEAASYVLHGTFKNDGGTLTQVGNTTQSHGAEDTAGWDADLDVNSTNVRVRVTGAASTNINWRAISKIYSIT